MGIHLKPHALKRMQERKIRSEHVEIVLSSPIETVEVRFSRLAAFGKVNGRYLVVIYQTRGEELEVITAFWIDKEGLRRFGFTRI